MPASVALYFTIAYRFTSSNSFANPAITVTRSLSDSDSGFDSAYVTRFTAAQFDGTAARFVSEAVFTDAPKEIA